MLTITEVQTGSTLIKGIGLRVKLLHMDLVLGIGRGDVLACILASSLTSRLGLVDSSNARLLRQWSLGGTSGDDASGLSDLLRRLLCSRIRSMAELVLDLIGTTKLCRTDRQSLLRSDRRDLGTVLVHVLECFEIHGLSD